MSDAAPPPPGALPAGAALSAAPHYTTLDALFAALEEALRLNDLVRADEIERELERRLFAVAAEVRGADARLSALRARRLAMPPPDDTPGEAPRAPTKPFSAEKGAVLELRTLERDLAPERAPDGTDFPVWFATNRATLPGDGFSGERGDGVTRGRVTVHIPKAHRFGETGSGFWKRLWRGEDRLALTATDILDRAAFLAALAEHSNAARAAGEQPQAMAFLHGYNVSFEEAAIRTAQIGYDLRVAGPTAFFSWPSKGVVSAYPADEASIEVSERAIADFLIEFSENCGTGDVHVVAHSMGNRGLLRALQRIAADAERRGRLKLNQIILAAPDVDRDLFLDLAHLYSAFAKRTTLYASARDLPVFLSANVHGAARAGYFEPYTVAPGVDTVAVPDFDVDLLGHGYFATAEAVLYDIYSLFRGNAPPPRQRMAALATAAGACWRLER